MTDPAIIHIVNGGGTRTVGRLCAQWKYITRKGTILLKRSERYEPATLPYARMTDWARDWQREAATYDVDRPNAESPQDVTTHIVASFPEGTAPEVAEAAGRAWARAMFQPDRTDPGNADYPDRDLLHYDYVTAFHRDTRHPHVHIIVRRRPIDGYQDENGAVRRPLLYIFGADNGADPAARRRMNCDNMRRVMVRVAGDHGIDLDARRNANHGQGQLTMGEYHQALREHGEQGHVIVRSHDAEGYRDAGLADGDHPWRRQAEAPAGGSGSGSGGQDRTPDSPRPGDGQWAPPTEAGPSRSSWRSRGAGAAAHPHAGGAANQGGGGSSGGFEQDDGDETRGVRAIDEARRGEAEAARAAERAATRRRREEERGGEHLDEPSQGGGSADAGDPQSSMDLTGGGAPSQDSPPADAAGSVAANPQPSEIDEARRREAEAARADSRGNRRRRADEVERLHPDGAEAPLRPGRTRAQTRQHENERTDAQAAQSTARTGKRRHTELERLHPEGPEVSLQPGRTRAQTRQGQGAGPSPLPTGPEAPRDFHLRDTPARREAEARARRVAAERDDAGNPTGPGVRNPRNDRGRTR